MAQKTLEEKVLSFKKNKEKTQFQINLKITQLVK